MPKLHVTKTYLPDQDKYTELLDKLWDSHSVTNNGKLSQQLVKNLKQYLGVPNLQYVSNGTIALQLGIKALDLEGEILTSPFTYVATANSIIWQNCTPVFVDIDPGTLTIDVSLLKDKITERTSAILGVHIYGYPGNVKALEDFASDYKLALLFDAAHAFGCRYRGRSLSSYGDLATLSFHATKVFHTIEGGAVIVNDDSLDKKIKLAATHGHQFDEYLQVGINAKNSEFHAGIGLLNLESFDEILSGRRKVFEHYLKCLHTQNLHILKPQDYEEFEYNYAYFPIIFSTESGLLKVQKELNKAEIYPRRYFYPALNTLPYLNQTECPVAEDIASRVLCLPLYHDLEIKDVERIANIINTCLS